MRKNLFISAVLVTAMAALQSCDKTTPAKFTEQQLLGDWHFLSGELMDVTSITPETVYHIDMTLNDTGTGTLTVWYEADSESITDKSDNIKWDLTNDRLTFTVGDKKQTFDVSLGDNGNLTLASQDQTQAEYRKDQFSNLKDKLLGNTWYTPYESKFRENISYTLRFKTDDLLTSLTYNKPQKTYTDIYSYYKLQNNTIITYFSKSRKSVKNEWPIKFLNEKYIGLGNMILQN